MAWGASSSPTASASLGKYQLVGKLASGGQAEVFLAVLQGARDVNRLVVVKKIRSRLDANDSFADVDTIAMLLDEARLASRLHHPNVIQTYEVCEQPDGTPFIVMEYLDGVPLSKLIRHKEGRARLTPLHWAVFGSEVLTGLAYAHGLADYDGTPLGIVHRDVSPQNIIVTYEGDVKLVDFGIAKAALNVTVTATGVFKGKLRYMAPEQLRGGCDQRSDIFSLGVVLWEALAGRRLFEGDDVQVLRALIQDDVPSILTVRTDVDVELASIIDRSLAKDADARWETANEMREALDAYLGRRRPTKADVAVLVRDLFKDLREEIQKQLAVAMSPFLMSGGGGAAGRTSAGNVPLVSSDRASVPMLTSERRDATNVLNPDVHGHHAAAVPHGPVPVPVNLPTIHHPSTPSETPIATSSSDMPSGSLPPMRMYQRQPQRVSVWPFLAGGLALLVIGVAIMTGVAIKRKPTAVVATTTTIPVSSAEPAPTPPVPAVPAPEENKPVDPPVVVTKKTPPTKHNTTTTTTKPPRPSIVATPVQTGPAVAPLPVSDKPAIKALEDEPKRNIKALD